MCVCGIPYTIIYIINKTYMNIGAIGVEVTPHTHIATLRMEVRQGKVGGEGGFPLTVTHIRRRVWGGQAWSHWVWGRWWEGGGGQ